MNDFSKEIRAYALKNAIEFRRAEPKSILSKLFQFGLQKDDIKEVMSIVEKNVDQINSMPNDEKEKEFQSLKHLIKEHVEKEKKLPELKNVSGEVVTRFPPEPSKYLHFGHALACLINYTYAKKYNGKFVVRFEDCNPEKCSQEYADVILRDLKDYLEVKIDSIRYISDDMHLFYDYAEKLIEKGKAFMCFCDRDTMQNLRHEGKGCNCRSSSVQDNKKNWKKFLEGLYAPGTATLRYTGDMSANNQVLRDPVLFRSMDAEHYRQGTKYKVWPMYDFYNPIEDSLMGVTHILRSNEFDVRVELHDQLRNLFGLNNQETVQFGRFNVIGAEMSGRDIREKVKSGEYLGWDDPRLGTLPALERRGIDKDVLIELINHIGLSKKQIQIDFAMIASISRKLLDKKVNRYFFVADPVELQVQKMPDIKEVDAKLHPDKPFVRKLRVGKSIFISKEDFEELKGKEIRLMNLFNIKLGDKPVFTGEENNPKLQKIHWVSTSLPARILMDNATWVEGLAEQEIANIKIGEVVQFERFGFCRLDAVKNGMYEFWFSHK